MLPSATVSVMVLGSAIHDLGSISPSLSLQLSSFKVCGFTMVAAYSSDSFRTSAKLSWYTPLIFKVDECGGNSPFSFSTTLPIVQSVGVFEPSQQLYYRHIHCSRSTKSILEWVINPGIFTLKHLLSLLKMSSKILYDPTRSRNARWRTTDRNFKIHIYRTFKHIYISL